ncbi:MAG TPA: hypothetical protein VK635_17490 [Bradyrhizobium sp.]|nr:hypothetical protein [Bradyrhizobium sp.]
MLVLFSVVFLLNREVTPPEPAASGVATAGDNQRVANNDGKGDERCPSGPCPEIVAPPPDALKPAPNAVAASPETPKSGSDTTTPATEVPKPGSEATTPATEVPKSGSEATTPATEVPKSGSEATTPATEVPKSGSEMTAPATEAPKSASETTAPATEAPKSALETIALPQLVLSYEVAIKVGHQIWLNETGGDRDAITSWNIGEEFASLGIGHFLWFPEGKKAPFDEDFPRVLEFLRAHNARLPSWVDKTPIPPCPWISRPDFIRQFNSPEMTKLREFLLDTVAGQTQFLVVRTQGTLDKILANTPDDGERQHIIAQFSRVARASKDLYPLIDYINFKGDGTDPAETALDQQTGVRQGWGLKQVLLRMKGTTSEPTAVLAEFTEAAQFVLRQRVRHIPANRVWEPGWLSRVETYRRPISDLELKGTRTGAPRKGG